MSVLVEVAAFGEIAMSFFVACATVRGNWSDVGVPPFVAVAVLGAMPVSLPLTWQAWQSCNDVGLSHFAARQYLVKLTTQVLLDKLLPANVPVWIVSLGLSKAFARVRWPALWRALSQQGFQTI